MADKSMNINEKMLEEFIKLKAQMEKFEENSTFEDDELFTEEVEDNRWSEVKTIISWDQAMTALYGMISQLDKTNFTYEDLVGVASIVSMLEKKLGYTSERPDEIIKQIPVCDKEFSDEGYSILDKQMMGKLYTKFLNTPTKDN